MLGAKGQHDNQLPATPWGQLPPRMRLLLITGSGSQAKRLSVAMAEDSAAEVRIEEALGMHAGLARLREENYDAVLVGHEPGELDALALLDAVKTGSRDEQPILVLGDAPEAEMDAWCYEAGADAYIGASETSTRTLLWRLARAIEHHRLLVENRQLRSEQRRRLEREHDEAVRLLSQQRELVHSLQQLAGEVERPVETPLTESPATLAASTTLASETTTDRSLREVNAYLSVPLVARYRELLQAYVVMGSGTLADEIGRMTRLLVAANATAQQAMMVHLRVLEEMVRELGSRSSRHVMSRADLLILELMIHLAESYRERFLNEERPITTTDSSCKIGALPV